MQKAKSKKKKFIDPKNEQTQSFAVIHRSQKDPLAADSDAPQRILQPLESKAEGSGKKNKEEEIEHGVFYDDQYDYLQHLKSRNELLSDNVWDEFTLEASAPVAKPARHPISNVKLPDVVFASKDQEEVGLLNKAAKTSGPLLDWDPDIVETLDDEFKQYETVYTLKDEDMEEDDNDEFGLDAILNKAQLEPDDEDEDGSDDYSDYDSDEALDDVPSLDGRFGGSNYSDEDAETGSKFTSYSMSSSVIRRNNGLAQLDDQFDKFFDKYEEDELGGCELDELEGIKREDSDIMKSVLAQHAKDMVKSEPHDVSLRKDMMDVIDETVIEEIFDQKELIEAEEAEPEDRFDCESILTTYSTLYNHPKMISEPSIKPIRINPKTGVPKDVLGKTGPGLTSAALKQLDRENDRFESLKNNCQNDVLETMTLASRVSELSFRNKHESQDEKKARKQAVKEFRKERRIERKANQDAFKEEKSTQERNAMNLRKNYSQAQKLV